MLLCRWHYLVWFLENKPRDQLQKGVNCQNLLNPSNFNRFPNRPTRTHAIVCSFFNMISAYSSIEFWDQYYQDLVEDASFEDPDTDTFEESKMSQLLTYKNQQQQFGQAIPLQNQRLQTTVGYLGKARYEWMQSFTSLRSILQQEIEPLMPGYTMPPGVLAKARAEVLATRQLEAGLSVPLAATSLSSSSFSSATKSNNSTSSSSKENIEPFLTPDPVLVGSDVRVLQVGCGTSNMGEEMINAGWPNVLNIDFSHTCIDICEEQWKKAYVVVCWCCSCYRVVVVFD